MSLRETLATPAGKAPYVRRLFGTIADRYDLITGLLSYGQDRRWKRRLLELAGPLDRLSVLDLACGTGDISFGAAARGASVTGLDLTPRMIDIATEKARAGRPGPPVRFLVGDMSSLPFPDATFDVVTTGYGLRNVPVLDAALDEIARVLRPGGLFLSLDFNRPGQPIVRLAYHAYLTVAGSLVGLVLHGNPDTYRYIAESIRRYPGADQVGRLLLDRGFTEAAWHRVLGGLLAIHVCRARAVP